MTSRDPRDLRSAIEDDGLRRLFDYWDRKRAGRRFPARRDIDPLDFPYILGWVSLVEVSHDPLRFRYRLYGSELADRLGFDMTGKYLDDYPHPEFRAHLERTWRETVTAGEPRHGFFDRVIDDRQMRFEAVRLPLSSDGRTIDMLLVAVHHRAV